MRGRFVLLSAAVSSLVALTLLVPSLVLARELAHSRALAGAQRLANDLTPLVATGADARDAVVDVNAEGGEQVRVLLPDGGQIGYGRSAVPARTLDRVRREARAVELRTGEGGVLLQPVPRSRQGMAIVEVTVRDGDLSRGVGTAWTALGAIAAVTVACAVLATDRLAARIVRPPRRPRLGGSGDAALSSRETTAGRPRPPAAE
ncbi:hypothetical protein AB0C21_28335 [Spirillospora sp. NPDC049024]